MDETGRGEDQPSIVTGADVNGGMWTDRRRRLQAALNQRDELFADLYRRALDALSERPLTRGSLVIAGHCIRDLINGLPDVLPDVEVPPYSDMTKPTRELSDVWAAHEDMLGPADPRDRVTLDAEDSELSPDARMTVPTVVVRAAARVVVATRNSAKNSHHRHSALVLGRVDLGADPTVKVFRDSARVFEQLRHPQRGREVSVTDDTVTRVRRALEVIEGALEARMGSFFATVEDLLDVLEAANKRDGADG
jgi:hypothetical protein